jgi:hypothetical protein
MATLRAPASPSSRTAGGWARRRSPSWPSIARKNPHLHFASDLQEPRGKSRLGLFHVGIARHCRPYAFDPRRGRGRGVVVESFRHASTPISRKATPAALRPQRDGHGPEVYAGAAINATGRAAITVCRRPIPARDRIAFSVCSVGGPNVPLPCSLSRSRFAFCALRLRQVRQDLYRDCPQRSRSGHNRQQYDRWAI